MNLNSARKEMEKIFPNGHYYLKEVTSVRHGQTFIDKSIFSYEINVGFTKTHETWNDALIELKNRVKTSRKLEAQRQILNKE